MNTHKADWDKHRNCLAAAPDSKKMQAIIESVGLSFSSFVDFYGNDVLQDAVRWGKDLKDRYTVLWLYNQFFAGNLGCILGQN